MPDEPKEAPKEEKPQEQKEEPVKEEPKQEKPQEQIDYEKSYKELQSKFGTQGTELGDLRKKYEEAEKNLENWKKLGAVIEGDPKLFEDVKAKLSNPEPKKEEPNGKAEPSEERKFLNKQIVGRFEEKYKISELEPEKAEALRQKIGTHLQLSLDPYGTGEKVDDLIQKVPLDRLPMYFENAYKLATLGDSEEQARLKGLAQAAENANGMIGSIPSSSANGNEITLTDKQKETARKLELSEKDYADYLKKQN